MTPQPASPFLDVRLTGGILRLQPLAPDLVRVRLREDGTFPEAALVRYGVLRTNWPETPFEVVQGAGETRLQTAAMAVTVSRGDGRLTLADAAGAVRLAEAGAPVSNPAAGFRAEFALGPDEKLYGLGDETRDRIEKRGHFARMWVRNVACYAPSPVLLSSKGWGLFLNTAHRHYVDLGSKAPDRLAFGGRHGDLDYFLFLGDGLDSLLEVYTRLAGRPHLLPLWGYGLTFVCNQQANAREMLDDCLSFRREQIPCDLVGLEPGWMSKYYDYSVDKQWHPERFYIPPWSPKGPHTFLGAAERLGFKVSLWLCCNYDLGYEEERRAGVAVERPPEDRSVHPDDFEQDQHFGHGPVLSDTLTKPDQPWFAHLRKFVDQGVSAFKMDGAMQVNEHPDRRWGNGMDDEEMHNLYPVLLNKQMHDGFREHTGRRPMIYSSGGYAGIQRYSATWAGDTGGGPRPLVSMLNHGLSGHVNTSCDMDVFTREGVHFGFFQPWSQVCSWAYWRHPWLLDEKQKALFRFYAELRYRLLPYIYSTAHVAARTGLPIMRAMPLAFPDDPAGDGLIHQYMFGDWFLTAAFATTVHLPEGRWIDYWTGTEFRGPADLPASFPEDRGGPLFVRAGAIIPEWPVMQYVGQKPVDCLGLDLYPHGESRFTLFEDDGVTFGHLDGQVAETPMALSDAGDRVTVTLAPRRGSYPGMPEQRSFALRLHLTRQPVAVTLDGTAVPEDCPLGWRWDAALRVLLLTVPEDPTRATARHVVVQLP